MNYITIYYNYIIHTSFRKLNFTKYILPYTQIIKDIIDKTARKDSVDFKVAINLISVSSYFQVHEISGIHYGYPNITGLKGGKNVEKKMYTDCERSTCY